MKNQTSPQLGILKEFEYEKTRVFAGISPLGEMVAIKQVCENLSIDRKWQQDKIKSDPYLSSVGGMVKIVASDGKSYPTYCLPAMDFHMWLWNITPTAKMNLAVWESYKRGLVKHLMQMLKISLDEIQKNSRVKETFDELKNLHKRKTEKERLLSENQAEARSIKSELIQIQGEIDRILGQNFNQLSIPMPDM